MSNSTNPLARRHLTDVEWLRVEYSDKLRGVGTIARELGCSSATVAAWLRRHDIPVRAIRSGKRRPAVQLGDQYGRLTVVAMADRRGGQLAYECICECGRPGVVVLRSNLRMGKTRSCGCLVLEQVVERCTTHGMCGHPSFNVWRGMHARCSNPRNRNFNRYGGRGIKVCDRWVGYEGLANFVVDMGERPSRAHQLHRVDNDRGYSPDNCEWLSIPDHRAAHTQMRRGGF